MSDDALDHPWQEEGEHADGRGRRAYDQPVIAHDAGVVLREIQAPTLITFGVRDLVCSTRFAEPLTSAITASELVVFDHLSHAGLHEDPETFNRATLDLLLRQRS